jgi:phosphoadenosine phosphosulfate reductase
MTQLSEVEQAPRLAERAALELADAPAADVIRWVASTFPSRWCTTSSMADAVLVHLVSQIAPGADIVFLNTGYHFPETLATRDTVATTYPVNVLSITPVHSVAAQDSVYGPRLHDRDPDLCCALRKVEPLERGLSGYDAWVTGMRRDESPTRADIPVVGWDERRGKVKVNPLATWTQADVDAYAAAHDVVLHPLLSRGYASIGCAPCTRQVAPGEDLRAGRWAGFGKTECGLHQ